MALTEPCTGVTWDGLAGDGSGAVKRWHGVGLVRDGMAWDGVARQQGAPRHLAAAQDSVGGEWGEEVTFGQAAGLHCGQGGVRERGLAAQPERASF